MMELTYVPIYLRACRVAQIVHWCPRKIHARGWERTNIFWSETSYIRGWGINWETRSRSKIKRPPSSHVFVYVLAYLPTGGCFFFQIFSLESNQGLPGGIQACWPLTYLGTCGIYNKIKFNRQDCQALSTHLSFRRSGVKSEFGDWKLVC